MSSDNETKRQDQENVDNNEESNETSSSSRHKKYRMIKGINGDFTIVDEHGCTIAIGLGL